MQVYVILCNKICTPPPPKEPSKQTNKKKLLFLTYNELILNYILCYCVK